MTLVASAALVSFMFPHCDYLKFFHSYFSVSSDRIETLDERLTNAMMNNSGDVESVLALSTPRVTSIGEAPYFYRFLHQGLASYFSCGMTMTFNSSRNTMRNQACNDMIQLISMVLYQPAQQNYVKSKSGAGISMPFFQLFSHLDRLHILQVCKALTLNPDFTNNNHAVLAQLRESLFGFASYVAQSDKEAAIAYEALVSTSLIENKDSIIQFELQRILQILVDTKSSIIIQSISLCVQEMILEYKGSESGDKTDLFCFALRLFADTLDAQIRSGKNAEIDMDSTTSSDTENVAKRQKLSLDYLKSIRLTAIMNGARVLFSTCSSNTLRSAAEEDPRVEAAIISTKQLIKNATTLLQCSIGGQLAIVQSASEFLSLSLSYETAYLTDTANMKHIFAHVRKSLSTNKETKDSDIIDALKPVIITCARQSGTFAVSLLSFGIKNYTTQNYLSWKLITYLSIGNPLVVSKRLPSFENDDANRDEEMSIYKIRTIISLAHGVNGESQPDYLQHCRSLSESIDNSWILFKLVRVAFQTSNYSFALGLLEKRLVNGCSRQQSFMWLTALSKLAHGEEVLTAKGAKGVAESFELLSSCQSMLTSLAALEQNGSFNFQLEYIRLRLDTLNLITIARSLAVEVLMTEGTLSSKNNRSNLFRKNIARSVGLLVSRYEKMHRLFGFHRCHQTRSTLRTLKAMCQLISDSASLRKEKKNHKTSSSVSTPAQQSAPVHDQNQSMNTTLSKLRSEVSGQMKSSKQKDDAVSRASALLFVLDTILSHPAPFPSGFFQVKPITSAIVNISADPNTIQQKITHDTTVDARTGAELIDVMPGLTAKVTLSGVIPDQFIQSASITFHEIVAWATVEYEGGLYEEENGGESRYVESKQVNGYPTGDQPNGSTSLLPGGKFIMSIPFEELLQEGYYKVNIELGCIDVRGGKWIIPTSSPLEVILRVDDE